MGFNMARPTVVEATSDRTDQIPKIIKQMMSQNRRTQLVCSAFTCFLVRFSFIDLVDALGLLPAS